MKTIGIITLSFFTFAASAEQTARGAAPSLSPDGRSVAYLEFTGQGAGYDIVIRDLERAGHVRLIEPDVSETQLAWSPDGRTLAYVKTDSEGRPVLWRVRGDERVATVLTEASMPFGVAFLDEGRVLLGLSKSLVIAAADGTLRTALDLSEAEPPVQLGTISISRSHRVAFTCGLEEDESESICVATLDDPEAAPVKVTSGHDVTPAWRGDEELIFSRAAGLWEQGGLGTWRRHLWSQNLRTGESRQLTFGDVLDWWPTVGRNGERLLSARVELPAVKTPPKRREKDTALELAFEELAEILRRSAIVTVDRD